ncbi:hypothetical protein OCU04_006395 [Sclerotinia nivalis]|uniref:Uncharacterized protein n=1 Tax=Sclerotinia nivalis TaxID=352851 RepID=A0A9X0AN54_9HELO|nr:hypothetical protein OCU04_006395 [Sclerotinia nivalis]
MPWRELNHSVANPPQVYGGAMRVGLRFQPIKEGMEMYAIDTLGDNIAGGYGSMYHFHTHSTLLSPAGSRIGRELMDHSPAFNYFFDETV